jgi:hypothetical protein
MPTSSLKVLPVFRLTYLASSAFLGLAFGLCLDSGAQAVGTYSSEKVVPNPLLETGTVSVGTQKFPYKIRNLPVSSFPDLPAAVATALTERGCVIPQTYEAHRPENVIHGSFEKAGSEDWAALCSAEGRVSLLVFFASSLDKPFVLSGAATFERLQDHSAGGELGFNWGIDPAGPKRIHDAQASMAHHPPPPDHDSLADSKVDHETIFHLYRNGAWETVDVD